MNLNRRPLPKHHRARLIAWTLAMLTWLASVLAGAVFTPRHERQRAERMSLAFLKRRVKLLIVSRAIDFICPRWPPRFVTRYRGRPLLGAGCLRALIGVRVGRQLKCKTALGCVLALLHALRNLDVHARALSKRLKQGLTRRWPKRPKPAHAAPALALAVSVAWFADSS